ncbi:MAG TPA: transcriptional regulator [Erysipelotrichaceae bacterium]|nr:transcriptional regulator [Erysipelotrichaceae bacterium]
MVFSSLTFLYAYLPVVLLAYFCVPMKWRNLVLLIVSLFFYGWGEPVYVLVMISSIVINWLFGKKIAQYRDSDRKKSFLWLKLCIAFNLILLGFFKYADFLIRNLNMLGLHLSTLNIALPIGISFYTFQTMSYPIDLYRKQTDPQKSLVSFGAYVTMFPQLIAGPIVRYTDIDKQLDSRTISTAKFAKGIRRFLCGLAKKVLLANNIGQVYEEIAVLADSQQSVVTAWLGIIAFAFQIYYDFSGYSDMAIGLGHMLGFDFPENFDHPYTSSSVTEFWRRWHMTLSFWFRDYVYIPLGGNRRGLSRQILNILIVWFLTGMWHGASWNFILWGLFYGIILIVEKVFLLKHLKKAPAWLSRLYTCFVFLLAWVLFAFTDFKELTRYLGILFGASGRFADGLTVYYLRNNAVLLISCLIGSTYLPKNIFAKIHATKLRRLEPLLILLVLFVCTGFMVDATYNPFLYFRF